MRTIEPRISDEVFGVLGVENSVKSRTSYGGTAPANVRREARRWLKRLAPPSLGAGVTPAHSPPQSSAAMVTAIPRDSR